METIRQLKPDDDLRDLIDLSKEFFQEYAVHHRDLFRIDEMNDSHITGYFSRFLAAEDSATFIAIVDGRTVGYMTIHVRSQEDFYKVKKVGAISGLMVHREHRRKGIATRLLAEARSFLDGKGVVYFTVYTASANEGAFRFYERNGMAPLHVTMVGETGTGPREP